MDVSFNPTTDISTLQGITQNRADGPNGMKQKVNDAVANLLGVSTDTLKSDLASGQTLMSVANAAGISSDALVSTIASTLAGNAPAGAPALPADQLKTMATDIATGAVHHHHHHGHRHGGGAGGSTPVQGVNTAPGADPNAGVQVDSYL